MLGRFLDHLFGYDFFISYSHADGKAYPRQLAQALAAQDFSVFLDEDVYAAGDELSAATLRRVGQSRRLVVVCGSSAARSQWVRREVEAYAARSEVPLVIEWDATLACDDEARWLREILGTTLTIREIVPRAEAPSAETVERLVRRFRAQRVERVRSALFATAAAVFAVLAVVAWIQRGRAVAETRRAISARLGMESSLALGRDPQQAVALAICAMSEEPLLIARESLTAALRATWGVEKVFRARSGALRDAAEIPATGTVAAAGQAGLLWTWSDGAAKPVERRLLKDEDLTALAVTDDSRRLAVGSVQGKLLILDAYTFLPALPPIALHKAGISRILSLGPRLIATVSYDSELIFLDPENGKIIARPPVFHQPGSFRTGIQDASYDPVRRRIVTVGGDGRLALWDVADQQRIRLLATAEQSREPGVARTAWSSVAVEPSRGLVAAGDSYGRLRLWRQEGDELSPVELAGVEPPAEMARQITGLAFDSAAGLLAVARSNGSLALWDVGGDLNEGDLPGLLRESVAHGASVNRAVFTAADQFLTSADDGQVVRWRFVGLSAPPLPFRPARGFEAKAVLSTDGAYVGGWDDRNGVTVQDARSQIPVGRLPSSESRIWVTAVAANGERLATGDETGTVVVWETKTRRLLLPPQEIHDGNVTALKFDPLASRWLISGDVNGSVVLIHLDGPTPRTQPLTELETQVTALAVSGDGSVLAAASMHGNIRFWRTEDWTEIGHATAPEASGIFDAALDGNGQHLALADRWGAILFFDQSQGSWGLRQLFAHGGQVRAVTFSPDGKLLASGGSDGRVVVWSTETGERQWAVPQAHPQMVEALAWSADGTTLFSVGDEGSVASWPFALSWWSERAAQVAPSPSCPE